MYDRNLTVYLHPYWGMHVDEMSRFPHPYPELAERSYVADSFREFDNISEYDVLEKESFYRHLYSTIYNI